MSREVYQFKVERKPGLLHVRVTGMSTAENLAHLLADTMAACRANDCARVMIEANLEGPSLQVFDIFRLVSETTKSAWPVIKHVAYLDMNPDHDVERRRFAETVAVNRGVDMRVFSDVSEAERWLTSLQEE